jgi:starch synthase
VEAPFAERMGLPLDGQTGDTLSDIGHSYADATLFPPGHSAADTASTFRDDADARTDQTVSLYDQMLGEVPA